MNTQRPTHQHMKQQFLFLLLFIVLFSACSFKELPGGSGKIWDYSNSEFNINIISPSLKGQSLINPTTKEGWKVLQQVKVEYKGETYQCLDMGFRALIERFKALYIGRDRDSYKLFFGEFQPHYYNETFTIVLPGNERHEVRFTSSAHDGKVLDKVWVDNVLQNPAHPYHITLETNNPIWLSSDKDTLRPTTLFFGLRDELPIDSLLKHCVLICGEKEYKLSIKEEIDEESEKESFYLTNTILDLTSPRKKEEAVLCFGPITLDKNSEVKKLFIKYKGHTEEINYTCYVDENGLPVYSSWREGYSKDKYQAYFNNGQITYLYLKE